MNSAESSGESSSSGQENGAATLDIDRPHKKARFPWQIKGKHHLKNQTDPLTASPAAAPEPEPASPATPEPVIPEMVAPSNKDSLDNEVKPRSEKRLIWHGSNRHQDSSTDSSTPLPLETVISLAESMLLTSETVGSNFTTTRNELNNMLEQNTSPDPCNSVITARDAQRLRKEEDRCITRWQAAQTVKGCFDNTINRVLDSWMSAPAPTEEGFLALDFARIMNDLPRSDDNVENEGILMAINAHGLQNMPTVGGIPAIAPSEQLARTLASNIPICEDSDSSICSEDFELPSERDSYPWLTNKFITTDQDQKSNEGTDDFRPPWRHENRNSNQAEPYQFFDNNDSANGEDYEYEFMNTAVIQAIKSKGLMAAGTDFG